MIAIVLAAAISNAAPAPPPLRPFQYCAHRAMNVPESARKGNRDASRDLAFWVGYLATWWTSKGVPADDIGQHLAEVRDSRESAHETLPETTAENYCTAFHATTRADGTPVARPAVTNPDWITKPNGDDMMTAYPFEAVIGDVEGHVTLECDVEIDGTPANCQVVAETPTGHRFGEAALSMTPKLRFRPMLVDGAPTGFGKVIIPIGFKISNELDNSKNMAAMAEKCVGFAGIDLGHGVEAVGPYAFWLSEFLGAAAEEGAKPSDILARVEASRKAAERAAGTERGPIEIANCRYEFAIALRMARPE